MTREQRVKNEILVHFLEKYTKDYCEDFVISDSYGISAVVGLQILKNQVTILEEISRLSYEISEIRNKLKKT